MKLKVAVQLGFLTTLIAVAIGSQAVEEVVVYGQRVPIGFNEYISSLGMGQIEHKSLFTSSYSPYGMTPLAHEMMKWHNRCGGILGNLMKSEHSCQELAESHHLDMLAACDAKASGRSVDVTVSGGHPYLGGALTWVAPSHEYAACADQADSRYNGLQEGCKRGFDAAKQADRTCRGASGW